MSDTRRNKRLNSKSSIRQRMNRIVLLSSMQIGVNIIGIPVHYKLFKFKKDYVSFTITSNGYRLSN